MLRFCIMLVSMPSKIKRFMESATGVSVREMSRVAGLNHTRVGRQFNGESELSATVVIAIARAYHLNVLDALVAGGFITREEAGTSSVGQSLSSASDLQLAQEIVRRAASGEAGPDLTEPLDADVRSPISLDDRRSNVSGSAEDDLYIPENVTEEWAGRYAAHPDDGEPEDHTP